MKNKIYDLKDVSFLALACELENRIRENKGLDKNNIQDAITMLYRSIRLYRPDANVDVELHEEKEKLKGYMIKSANSIRGSYFKFNADVAND